MQTLTLNNGVEMPALGLGVFQTPPDETRAAVKAALDLGYRHIDTAAAYGNEREVGQAIRDSGVPRDEIFIETKIWISDYGYDATLHGFAKSAAKLGVDQIDLLILHQALPSEFDKTLAAYRSLEKLLADGKVRAIGVKPGDVVVAPFVWADNTCTYCREGLQTSCPHGGQWGVNGVDGGQGQAARVPQADGTLVKLPVGEDSELLPDLLTLSDVLCTGYHAARTAGVQRGDTLTVIGDGAVGLSAVISARLLGVEQIILMGRHRTRTDLGRDFGATDVIAERGDEGIARVRELTGGEGTRKVLECVGLEDALVQSLGVVRDGGTISRVEAPQFTDVPFGFADFMRNITLTGGIAPARAYIEELMPHILDGTIRPGRVFDRTVALDDIADGYQAMNDREALKVLVRP